MPKHQQFCENHNSNFENITYFVLGDIRLEKYVSFLQRINNLKIEVHKENSNIPSSKRWDNTFLAKIYHQILKSDVTRVLQFTMNLFMVYYVIRCISRMPVKCVNSNAEWLRKPSFDCE